MARASDEVHPTTSRLSPLPSERSRGAAFSWAGATSVGALPAASPLSMDDETRQRRLRVAIVGLPSVGKSTFVAALHGKPLHSPEPTQGCNKSTVGREDCNLELLDLGGKSSIRKFWRQLTTDAQGLVLLANAAEADDMAWGLLANELRSLRSMRPVLLLLNQRDVPAHLCTPTTEALRRLGLQSAPDVGVATIANSTDVEGADPGIAWLCELLLGGDGLSSSGGSPEPMLSNEPPAFSSGSGMMARAPHPPSAEPIDDTAPRSSRLRVLRELRDAREYTSNEASEVAELQERLMAGYILSEEELEMIRAAIRTNPSGPPPDEY